MDARRCHTNVRTLQRKLSMIRTRKGPGWWNWFHAGYCYRFRLSNQGFPRRLPAEGVSWIKDVRYGPAETAGSLQAMDVFCPNDLSKARRVPVVMFIHGGAWRAADKQSRPHVHTNVCISLAQRGWIAVNVNHQLSPRVQHPEHARDIALALKWVHEEIHRYGGDGDRVVAAGHSSGGHLASLVALDERYLRRVGVHQPRFLRGFIGISGVYDIERFSQNAFARRCMIQPAFGTDRSAWGEASPIHHVRQGVPPALLIAAEHEEAGIDQDEFGSRLREMGNSVETVVAGDTDHFTILSRVGLAHDTLIGRMSDFIESVV